MSIYGLARLLGSRDVGPAKLIVPIESFNVSARQHHDLLDSLFDALGKGADRHDGLGEAAALVEGEARRVCAEIDVAFDQPLKLKARQRLELERAALRLGGQLEAVRWLATVTAAALRPREALVSPGELLGAQWRSGPTFVAAQIKLVVPAGLPAKLYGDPLVLRALLELHVRRVHAAGVDLPVLGMKVDGADISLQVGEQEGSLATTVNQVKLLLGVSLDIEETVLAAVAEHLGIAVAAEPGGALVTLGLRAA
ncbi:MAG: hypothetical protein JRI68_13735 [Deltaproteobacteria bacterium]|nr:hypothetical protein [Deltaproteobacteria bacterium]